jgi:hypothetical protein
MWFLTSNEMTLSSYAPKPEANPALHGDLELPPLSFGSVPAGPHLLMPYLHAFLRR